jgi:preprotein translocase subunit SecY
LLVLTSLNCWIWRSLLQLPLYHCRVVIITEGQRNVPVSYARRVRVWKCTAVLILTCLCGFLWPELSRLFCDFNYFTADHGCPVFLSAKSEFLVSGAERVIALFQNQIFYGVLYFLLVFVLYFLYWGGFKTNQIAKIYRSKGGLFRHSSGKHTEEYLAHTTHRIILAGAIFLGLIAVLPLVVGASPE